MLAETATQRFLVLGEQPLEFWVAVFVRL